MWTPVFNFVFLSQLLKGVTIAAGGVLPNIHPELLAKKRGAKGKLETPVSPAPEKKPKPVKKPAAKKLSGKKAGGKSKVPLDVNTSLVIVINFECVCVWMWGSWKWRKVSFWTAVIKFGCLKAPEIFNCIFLTTLLCCSGMRINLQVCQVQMKKLNKSCKTKHLFTIEYIQTKHYPLCLALFIYFLSTHFL